MFWVLIFGVLLVVIIVLADYLMTTKDKLANLRADYWELLDDYDETIEGVERVVIEVAPLIEQTDWMTGRWNGRFDDLVGMERKRNIAVVRARKALFDIPAILEQAKVAVAPHLPQHLQLREQD